jgi:hypothetical protein
MRYTFLLNILEDVKLITRSSSYSTGKKYINGGKEYLSNPFSKNIISRDITEDILKEDIEYQLDIKMIYDEEELNTMESWIKRYRDQENIIKMIYETYYDIDEVRAYLMSKRGQRTKKGRLIDDILINNYTNRAIKYNRRIYNFILTDEGRFYNPAAYQPSVIRPLLKINGDKLVDIDVKNSQPLLLSYWIKNDKWKEAVENGSFYETLSNELEIDRERIKLLTMKYIFFSKKPLKSGKLWRAMRKHYGDTIDQINELKTRDKLWQLLQRAEADIFIKGLVGNYISIHDGILVKNDDLATFLDKIYGLYNEIGIKPTLTIN